MKQMAIFNSNKVNQAKYLGKQAFNNGLKRVPALDTGLAKVMEGLKVGDGVKLLDAWLSGWDNANLNQDTNE